REELEKYRDHFLVETKIPSGTRLIVKDREKTEEIIRRIYEQDHVSLNHRNDRISVLLNYILKQKREIPVEKLARTVFVSVSTVNKDLQMLDDILKKYGLDLNQKRGGVLISGKEIDKRKCLVDNGIFFRSFIPSETDLNYALDEGDHIREVLVSRLVDRKCTISDIEFQNLVAWLKVSLDRMKSGFFLDDEGLFDHETLDDRDVLLASHILDDLFSGRSVSYTRDEILFLATYLNNHSNYIDVDYISPDLNDFIREAMHSIEQFFPVELSGNSNLKISLALHSSPLISRAKNDMQIRNNMTIYVKQNFSFAFDIAAYYVCLLSNRYGIRVSEDETAFVAILFNRYIYPEETYDSKKRICIITAQVRSSSFLIEQLLLNKYGSRIAGITIVESSDLDHLDLKNYDLFLSTESNIAVSSGLAYRISSFPNEKEIDKIGEMIIGYDDAEKIISFFDPRMIFFRDKIEQKDVEELLISKAVALHNTTGLREEIELRNTYGSTYFGNSIAILHPMRNISEDSFIGAVILREPIRWSDEGQRVKVIFLVCLEKNNHASFRAWDSLSSMIFTDKNFIGSIESIRSVQDFIDACYRSMKRGQS
ncbi:MAG: PRD domain-containing protein, partial [Erysipelotrichaceae bacterium]|nr:PRD domain-containing protein [Erysipelotrichaceae bacterium]